MENSVNDVSESMNVTADNETLQRSIIASNRIKLKT